VARRLWIGGRIQAPVYVTDPVPRRPDFVAWIDTVSGKIVEGELAEPTESVATLAECLTRAIHAPNARPPDRVRVADAILAEAVRGVVGDRARIEIAPTPEFAELAASMADFFSSPAGGPDEGEPPSYLEGGRVTPGTAARFFEAAAKLYHAAPWQTLWDADVIALDIPQFGFARAALSVIGRAGQNYGFMIFDSASDYDAFGAAGGDPFGSQDLGASTLSLNFETKSRLPASMRAEIKRNGWPIAGPKAHPFIMAVDRDRVYRPLLERDVRVIGAVAESLASFYSKHRLGLTPDRLDPIVEEYSLLTDDEPLTVRLRAPHPEMPWLPNEEETLAESDESLDSDDLDGDDDEEASTTGNQQVVEAFVRDQKAQGRTESELDAAGFIAESFLRYKTDYLGGSPRSLTEVDAEGFLLDHFPRKVSADEPMIEHTPRILVSFCDWLAARGDIAPRVAGAARTRVAAIRDRFLAAARDPSRFGPAKSFVMGMHAEGVDFTDEAAVQDHMLRYNAGLTRKTQRESRASTLVSVEDGAREPTFKFSPRWVPEPGTRPPSVKAACPCGSGRAYGKCCRPR
jgi:hypothetical protein